MLFGQEKVSFLNTPTPLERLPRISEELGLDFYIKRDDLTNLGVGGNKLRKLEYLLADAKRQGATTLLTMGGAQTNHGRLTAAVAAKYGMKCVIVCLDDYPGRSRPTSCSTVSWAPRWCSKRRRAPRRRAVWPGGGAGEKPV